MEGPVRVLVRMVPPPSYTCVRRNEGGRGKEKGGKEGSDRVVAIKLLSSSLNFFSC